MPSLSHPYPATPTRVVFTRGSDYEIGRQHAEALGKDANDGMVEFYYRFWRRMIAFKASAAWEKPFAQGLRYLLDPLLVGKLSRNITPGAVERLKGMSSVSGRPLSELFTTLVLPDLMPLLEVYVARIRPNMFLRVMPPPHFGCSSFISSGKNFLHGRNLDFPGVGYWDRYPVIQMTERTGALRFIGITTAGAPFCGITGINEAQISVSLHQHYCREGNTRGTLPFLIGEEILAKARTLKEAREILKQWRVAASWAFLVADGKSRTAFIQERHPGATGTRELSGDGHLSHSNFFQTTECQPAELATTTRMNWDNYCRRDRVHALVAAEEGQLSPERAVQIVSDHFDPFWGEEKILNRTISQVYNIQSLVLDLEKMKLFLAEGNAPVQLGSYSEFDLGEIFSGREGRTGQKLPAYRFQSEAKREAKVDYILSFVAAFDGNERLALERLESALSRDFVPEAALVAGVVCMKLLQWPKALQFLERGRAFIEEKCQRLRKKHFPPEYFELILFQARTLDLLERRAEAEKEYSYLANHEGLQDTHIRTLAKKAGPFKKKHLGRILMPYSSYIPLE